MRASVALPSPGDAASTIKAWATRVAAFLERRRWWVVAVCIVGQWAFLWREVNGRIPHNHWLFAHGDDGPWYWTTAWAQSSLHVPITAIGPGWPYILTPLAAIFGPDMANGLPWVIALNVLVLAPASVVGMYLVGERIAGRVFGAWTAVLWTLMPALGLQVYNDAHRRALVDFLSTGMGLNALSDYPSMVCAIFCAYLILRALDTGTLRDGLLAGILLGFLVLLKPANGPLLVPALAVLAVTFRFRALAGTLAAMAPAALALIVWKRIGTGTLPVLSPRGRGGGGGGATAVVSNSHKYVNINFHHLAQNAKALSEVVWSFRVLEFLLVAGVVGLIGRGRWKGAFVAGWFVSFGLIKGTVSYANVYDTSVYRFLLPAWPAWTLIVAGVVFCWPAGEAERPRRRDDDRARARVARAADWRLLAGVAVVLALVPLVVVVADSPAARGAIVQQNYVGAPVGAVDFGLQAHRIGPHTVRLEWNSRRSARAVTTYAIFKAKGDGCVYPTPDLCRFTMQLIGISHTERFSDTQAVGRVQYRVGLVSGSTVQVDSPALLLVSKPLVVTGA
jgi:hypothetical protein